MPTITLGRRRPDDAPSGSLPDQPDALVPVTKLRRRPGLVVGAAVAVLLGATGSAWAWTASSNATDVVAVRTAVQRGEVVGREDLMVVRVGTDPALRTVAGSDLDSLVGQRAATDLASGALVTPDQVTTAAAPRRGQSIVGVALPEGSVPSEPLLNGDVVRIVDTPGAQSLEVSDDPDAVVGTVVSVRASETQQQTVVDVLVPAAEAARLAARAATGNVALVLDSRER